MRPDIYCYWCNRDRTTFSEKGFKCAECCKVFSFLDRDAEVQTCSYDDDQVVDGHHQSHGYHSGW